MPIKAAKVSTEFVALNMKVAQDLRVRLEKAAQQSGRSLNSEAAYRIERSFDSSQSILEAAADYMIMVVARQQQEDAKGAKEILRGISQTAKAAKKND